MQNNPFYNSERKLIWTTKRLDVLYQEFSKWRDTIQYEIVYELDKSTGDIWYKIKGKTTVSEEIYENVAIIVYHLRSILDQMTVALGVMCGLEKTKHLHFPFEGDSVEYFKASGGRRKLKGLKPDLIAIFDSLEPYKVGGNSELYSLADLANVDKHNIIFPVGSIANVGLLSGLQIKGAKQLMIFDGGVYNLTDGIPIANLGQTGTITPLSSNSEIGMNPNLSFGNIEGFNGQPIIPKLKSLTVLVEEIVKKFKAHCEDPKSI